MSGKCMVGCDKACAAVGIMSSLARSGPPVAACGPAGEPSEASLNQREWGKGIEENLVPIVCQGALPQKVGFLCPVEPKGAMDFLL